MKIAIIGANGLAGTQILNEAIKRKIDSTAIVRHKSKLKIQNIPTIEKDLYDLSINDLKNFDVIVVAFKAPNGKEKEYQTAFSHLANILNETNIRLIIVGGAGILYTNSDRKLHLFESPDFPADFLPTAKNMAIAFEQVFKNNHSIKWTYISPSAFFNPNGEKTGKYKIGKDILCVDKNGNSEVSYGNFAVALVDEIKNAKYIQKQITIVNE